MFRRAAASSKPLQSGYRSKFEETIAAYLSGCGVPVVYEKHKVRFSVPVVEKLYTPDFTLPNGILIEAKGWWESKDRTKHLNIRATRPDLDIRFVFQNPNVRISKSSKTTYAMWCDKQGIKWANKVVPPDWIAEPGCAHIRSRIDDFCVLCGTRDPKWNP